MKWVSLHGHSTFSFQDGFGPVADHVARVKDLGMNTLALTEHGNVSSHVQLEKACNEAGIRPIFGVEAYVAPPGEKLKFHLTILAMNVEGYTNLNRIVTSSWLYENFHYYPTVHDDVLEKYNEGLIILSGCADSQLACTLFGGKSLGEKRLTYTEEDWAAAVDLAMWYKNTFGDRYYLEVQRLDRLPRTRAINKAYEKLSKETGIPLVATADVHYPFPEDNDMQTVLHAAGRGSDYETTRNSWDYSVLLTYPESDREVYDNMVKTGLSPEAAAESCRNTAKIAARCDVKLPQNEPIKFPVPEEFKDVEDMVWAKLREGWEFRIKTNKRMRKHKKEYVDRLHYEMERIVPRGFCDYFMMLADVVVWAKEQKIPVGPARGSAASSLVCYLMRITEVDPLEFPQMMFERFIDPKRLDLPDVDLDFADDRRHEVIHHLQERWGYDHVGNIGNFNRYRGKNSIDDIARVFHIPKFAAEGVKDLIIDRSGGDSRAADSLQDTFDMFPKAEALAEKFPALRRATKLEGNYKGLGIHAAGVVISNNPIEETCALYEKKKSNGDDVRVVPYDKKDAVYLGMLKADFLGLSTMGLIGIALDIIGMDLEDLYRIPLDEPETIAAFNRADVVGIFQFEGRATRLVCQDVKPETFLELADINALSRPGPLFSGMTSSYIDIKHGRAEPDHLHPIVDSFTAWSKYQIVYQEQVLSIIRDVGGFSVQRVGDIRKIISQKLGEASFNSMYEEFEKGAKELHGIDSKLAMKIWKFMVTSATYSFCVTGDTVLEKAGKGRYARGEDDEFITAKELYEASNDRTNIPLSDKIRGGRLKLMGMDDDGRIRPNNLIKIHDPVDYRCTRVTLDDGTTCTFSNDHRVMAVGGYKHTLELEVGDELVRAGTKAEREQERKRTGLQRQAAYQRKATSAPQTVPHLLKAAKVAVYDRAGGACEHCGEPNDHINGGIHSHEFAHIMPLVDFDDDFTKYHAPSNLMYLCNSCHKRFDYNMNGTRKKRHSVGRPTFTQKIVKIEDAGIQPVYDISMAGPTHNYVGNGLIHHNNIAHSISYAMLAFWCMWLKVHHPVAFYTAALQKTGNNKDQRPKLIKLIRDANRHGVPVVPPSLNVSGVTWTAGDGYVTAGFSQVPGVGERYAANILAVRDKIGHFSDVSELSEAKGIGPKSVKKIKEFMESEDPFGLGDTERALNKLRDKFADGTINVIPAPTHTSSNLPKTGDTDVVWMGMVKNREFKDIIEDERAKTGDSLEEIRARVKAPELAKSCTLHCYDDGDEEVYARINRMDFPFFKESLEDLVEDSDIVVIKGRKREGFGLSIRVEEMYVIQQ